MFLTIAIPVYNDAISLSRTLSSVIQFVKQSNEPIEVLISDNNSVDSSLKVAREVSESHTFVRVLESQVNKGFGANLKKLGDHAYGDYIWFLGVGETLVIQEAAKVLEVLKNYKPTWMTVAGCFDDEQKNSSNIVENLECDFLSNDKTPLFSETISLLIFESTVWKKFKLRGLSPEADYWPHLEAIKFTAEKGHPVYLYHPRCTVKIAPNYNGFWYETQYATDIYESNLRVSKEILSLVPESIWLSKLVKRHQGSHALAFIFMTKLEGLVPRHRLLKFAHRVTSSRATELLAVIMVCLPGSVFRIASKLKRSLLKNS